MKRVMGKIFKRRFAYFVGPSIWTCVLAQRLHYLVGLVCAPHVQLGCPMVTYQHSTLFLICVSTITTCNFCVVVVIQIDK